MTEDKYWSTLEYALTRKIEESGEYAQVGLWFDGFEPLYAEFDVTPPCMHGFASLGFGPRRQERWRFTLFLHGKPKIRAAVDWTMQMPPDDMAGWIALDFDKEFIEMGWKRA